MAFKLSSELVHATKGRASAIRKKEETHRMAEAISRKGLTLSTEAIRSIAQRIPTYK